jgi:hypothetical protein
VRDETGNNEGGPPVPLLVKRLLLGLCALLGAGALVWLWQYTRDEAQIQRRIADVTEALRAEGSGKSRAFHAERLRRALLGALSADVRIEMADLPIALPSKREDLSEAVVEWTELEAALAVDTKNPTIQLEDSHTRAQAKATVTLHGQLGPEAVKETRPTELVFRKEEGGWKITSVRVGPPVGERTGETSDAQRALLAPSSMGF